MRATWEVMDFRLYTRPLASPLGQATTGWLKRCECSWLVLSRVLSAQHCIMNLREAPKTLSALMIIRWLKEVQGTDAGEIPSDKVACTGSQGIEYKCLWTSPPLSLHVPKPRSSWIHISAPPYTFAITVQFAVMELSIVALEAKHIHSVWVQDAQTEFWQGITVLLWFRGFPSLVWLCPVIAWVGPSKLCSTGWRHALPAVLSCLQLKVYYVGKISSQGCHLAWP